MENYDGEQFPVGDAHFLFFVMKGEFFMYQALYRKWRPAFFDDVVGQEHITSILKSPGKLTRLRYATFQHSHKTINHHTRTSVGSAE